MASSFSAPHLADFLIQGFKLGFRNDFNRSTVRLSQKGKEYGISKAASKEISDYLQKELQEGKIVGLVDSKAIKPHTSPFGVIPKQNKPGKRRLILDHSSPTTASINDEIDPSQCSVHYSGLNEALVLISRLGRGSLLANTDLKTLTASSPSIQMTGILKGFF